MKPALQRRLVVAFVAMALGISALFGLFAMAFAYTVEDVWIERLLQDEAGLQDAHFARHGHWAKPQRPFVTLYEGDSALPHEVARVLADEPGRTEVAGEQGRHYHLHRLQGGAGLLVAEVGGQLVVRSMRQGMLFWLALWSAAVLALAFGVAVLLARRLARPLQLLAARAEKAAPEQLPMHLSQGFADDEVGAVARRFEALLGRTRALIEREQAFSRDASHELRTPLTVLRMGIDLLQAEPGLQAGARRQLLAMRTAVDLMAQTVQTLLLLAREEDVMPVEPVAVLPVAERWILAHADWLDMQALTLDLRIQAGDSLRLPLTVLQLALASLLSNAFAHGESGGQVLLDVASGCLRVGNPSGSLPAGVGGEHVKRDGSPGQGLGLSILRRALARCGAELAITHADGWTWVSVSEVATVPTPDGS